MVNELVRMRFVRRAEVSNVKYEPVSMWGTCELCDATRGDPIFWEAREWLAVSEAMRPEDMRVHLRAYFPYDSEAAAHFAIGGTFDVVPWQRHEHAGTFMTYTVVAAHPVGWVRLYRAADVRELRDGMVW